MDVPREAAGRTFGTGGRDVSELPSPLLTPSHQLERCHQRTRKSPRRP